MAWASPSLSVYVVLCPRRAFIRRAQVLMSLFVLVGVVLKKEGSSNICTIRHMNNRGDRGKAARQSVWC